MTAQDGTVTLSAKWTTWAAIALVLVTGSGAGYMGVRLTPEDDYTARKAAVDWAHQAKINSQVASNSRAVSQLGGPNDPIMPRVEKLEGRVDSLQDILYEIRADVRVIKTLMGRSRVAEK